MNKAERSPDMYVIKPELQMCYAYQEPGSKTWSRVRLLKVMDTNSMEVAMVYYIDWEFKGLVPPRGLRQLPDKWLHPVVPVFRCHLYDIIPIGGGGDYHWSDEANAFFGTIVKESKSYLICPVNWSAAKVHGSLIDTRYDIGVMIFFPCPKNGPLRCVNYEMITKGYASAIGPGASHINMLYLPQRLPQYKGHINGGSESETINENVTSHQLVRDHLSLIKISHVLDPSCIFVQMTAKLGEFKAMTEDLGRAVKDLKAIPRSDLKIGLSIACVMTGCGDGEFAWNRAVIYDKGLCAKCIKVILVDYGDIIFVSVRKLYPLPEKFQSIHSFAIRVHLSEIYPVEIGDQTTATSSKPPIVWSERTNSALNSLACALEVDNPFYYTLQPCFSDVIQLRNIRQKLEFDTERRIWKACETRGKEQGALDKTHEGSVRKNPLLSSHFYSFGVEIMYEVDENQGLFAKQEYFTDLLLECANNDVGLIKPRINRKKYFRKLIELYESQAV